VTRPYQVRFAVLLATALSAALLLSGGSGNAAIPAGAAGVSIIAQNGFGNRNNSYAWSMGWFKGHLYVGTARDELCTEKETSQFYYPKSKQYVTNPSPNVHCTKNAYKLPLRAQIWRYTPRTQRWKMVYRSPLIANPLAKGTTVSRDMAYRGMTTFTNSHGRKALFVSAVTPDEYLPPLQKSHPPVLLRSFDGVHWTVLHLPETTVHYPFGPHHPMGFRDAVVLHHHLYVTATASLTGDGGIFEVKHAWKKHPRLVQVSTRTQDIFELQKFDGKLYIGTGSDATGYGVYRTSARGKAPYHWQKVLAGGAGRGHLITSVVSMHVYRNRLYVGSSGWYNKDTIPSSELIRIAPDGTWTLVVGNPRTLKNGRTVNPVSGLYDGFFNPFAAHFWRMATQGTGLFLGTNDWSYAIQQDKSYAWLDSVLSGELGFDLWATCDGNDWFAVTRDAFDGNQYNFGGRTLITHGSHLYIGTANQAQGTSIFDDHAQSCSSLINGHTASDRPDGLMTNHAKAGTLLSWEPNKAATSYVVLRASFQGAKIGLRAPVKLPTGLHYDDAVPHVTRVGAKGSHTVSLSLPGAFKAVATTTKPYFVDPVHGHFVYEVEARSAAGTASQPSNIEVSPSAGPPSTFGGLRAALVPATADAKVAAATAVSPRTERLRDLLDSAEVLFAHGHGGAARREVRRVQALAGDNDELAAGAARLARRLQYAQLIDGR
jgi:hypothetical protein